MELVAPARLRRAQLRIEAMRPYADRMLELMAGVSQAAGAVRLPLLERRENVEKVAIVPVTGDRGLAGAFNAQVLRRAFAIMREVRVAGQEPVFYPSGKKAGSTLRFRRLEIGQAWSGFSERPEYRDAQAMAHALAEAYVNKDVDRVVIVYNAFVSPRAPGRDHPGDPRGRRRRGRADRLGSNGASTALSSPRSTSGAKAAAVAGASVTPSIAWPAATYTFGRSGTAPISGRPSAVLGRSPAHASSVGSGRQPPR